MGSECFSIIGHGDNAKDAFDEAKNEAQYDHGHSGYTGTIAEKDDFIIIKLPEGNTADDYSNELMGDDDPRIASKWGPAGCIEVSEGTFLFFGWASS